MSLSGLDMWKAMLDGGGGRGQLERLKGAYSKPTASYTEILQIPG